MINRPKTIITTDMEVDDMNSLIHLCLFLDQVDLKGVIYTSSQYHFNGDGIHTLKQVTPHYRTKGNAAWESEEPVANGNTEAGELKQYRPMELGWIESLWDNEYRDAYQKLSRHSEYFPTPEYLLSITKYGNIDFEGDVTKVTEGSELIKEEILNTNEDLYLQSWGGCNTIVRALMSIYEEYHDKPKWDEIYKHVCDKVKIFGIINGVGQDCSWLDHGQKLFPDLKPLSCEFYYGIYFSSRIMQEDCIDMFQADWLKKNIKFDHGPLMSKYFLFGDGSYYKGEPDKYQFGIHPVIDWRNHGYPLTEFEPYEFLGEGDSCTYVQLFDVGLRGLQNHSYGTLLGKIFEDGSQKEPNKNPYNPFIKGYQEEWAVRADWCVKDYDDCVHVPEIETGDKDLYVRSGETVTLYAKTQGDITSEKWVWLKDYSSYKGSNEIAFSNNKFTVPEDAEAGDYFNVIYKVVAGKEKRITRYAQFIIHVV